MNYDEYKQLTAYARYDGFYLAIIWVASFACTLGTPLLPFLGQFSTLLLVSTPFFVAYRLKVFREEGRDGAISFRRALFYSMRVFFNAGIIFSLLQWLYMSYLDNGKLLQMVTTFFSTDEGKQLLLAAGYSHKLFMSLLPEVMQPLTLASTSFIYAMLVGSISSLVIAAVMAKRKLH
ncbi:MAG: DUF4199 domain-containing protein [Prevotella sp.]|nr:DUF4199 domain-containing protein [Prevotella sp.]